jgi:hypothetical protein
VQNRRQETKISHPLADTSEICRFLSLISEPGQIFELRLLHVRLPEGRFSVNMSGYFNDHGALAENAKKYNRDAQGLYITLNPINPALLARAANRLRVVGKDDLLTSDRDILVRRWLPIDLDPVRPAGISSTEEEHGSALERALQIRDALHKEGWPAPIVGDSGNGGHLLYNIDLPSNDEGLVKQCLQALARRFDDDIVKIDQSVFNPSRIWKLYGTVSRKGDPVAERPHRLARILESL